MYAGGFGTTVTVGGAGAGFVSVASVVQSLVVMVTGTAGTYGVGFGPSGIGATGVVVVVHGVVVSGFGGGGTGCSYFLLVTGAGGGTGGSYFLDVTGAGGGVVLDVMIAGGGTAGSLHFCE